MRLLLCLSVMNNGMSLKVVWLCVSSSVATFIAVKVWDAYIEPHLWKRKVRRAALESGEPCVLDASPGNVAAFRRGGVALIMKDVRASGLAQHIVDFVHGLLIARGADQAFRTKVELVNFKKVMQHFQKQLEEVESNLSVFAAIAYCDPSNAEATSKDDRKRAAKIAKQLDECRGCLHAVRETRTWTAAICKVPRFPSTEKMFIASDGSISLLPAEMNNAGGLARRVEELRRVVEEHTPSIMDAIAQHGWPPPYTVAEGTAGKHRCRHCQGLFGGKWIRAASCWKCRFELRAAGKCPYASFDGGKLCVVCPHQRKCLRCEQASCSECKVLHTAELDEGVRGLVQELQPHWLFLDFDQTLSGSTPPRAPASSSSKHGTLSEHQLLAPLSESKNGALPVLGKHGMNPELVDVARRKRERVMVITRQHVAHQGAIRDFLAAAGLEHVQVTCLGGQSGREKRSKADVMREALAGEGAGAGALGGVFVDDDAREVLAPALAPLPLLRVLFVSSSWELRPAA